MGRSFTNETRKAFSTKKRDGHIARARWARENAGVRLRSLASDLVWFDELKTCSQETQVSLATDPQEMPVYVPPSTPALKAIHFADSLTEEAIMGLSSNRLRKLRGRICERLGTLWRQKRSGLLSEAQRSALTLETKTLNRNCALINQVLAEREEKVTP